MARGPGLIVFGKKSSRGGRSGLLIIIIRTAQSSPGKLDVSIKRLCGSKQHASLFQTLLLLAALPVLLLVLGHLLRPHLPHQVKEDLRTTKHSIRHRAFCEPQDV